MKSSQIIKHHPVKTAFAVVGFLLLIAAVCYGINFKRTLNRVVAWEDLNQINYRLHDYLTDHQDLPLSEIFTGQPMSPISAVLSWMTGRLVNPQMSAMTVGERP